MKSSMQALFKADEKDDIDGMCLLLFVLFWNILSLFLNKIDFFPT